MGISAMQGSPPREVSAYIGVHGKSAELHLEKLWSQNITLTTRLADTVTTPLLMNTLISGVLQPQQLITRRFKLAEIMKAYDTFAQAAENRALKVIIVNSDGH
jgi:alcohol dehydrogenase